MRIDDDPAAIVLLHADGFETEAFGVRHAADRHENDIGFDRLRSTAARGRLDFHLQCFAGGIDRRDLRRQFEGKTLLLQHAVELVGDLAIDAGQNVIEEFDDRHLGAEPPPHRAELEPDDAGADDEKLLRHLGEIERAGRRHDALFVDVDAGQPRHVRASGNDDVLGFERLRLAVVGLHLDLARRRDAACAVKRLDLVLLEQIFDAFDVTLDALLLVLEHRREIDARLADLDAHVAELVAGLLVKLRRIEHRLRRDAADIEASAAEGGALLHHRGLHAKLRRANGADIAAGAAADDDEVVGH